MRAILAICFLFPAAAQDTAQQFARLCGVCHGDRAAGTDRGPALVNSRSLRNRSEKQIHDLIRNGTPGGMPPFALPEDQLQSLAHWVRSLNTSAHDLKPPGDAARGEQFFLGKGQCSSCHMVAGRGGTNGPDLSEIGRQLTLRELELSLDDPTSRLGTHSSPSCPGWAWCPQDPWSVVDVRLRDGSSLRGFARSQGRHDLQLQTLDGRLHLLVDSEYDQVTPEKTALMPALKATVDERRDLLAYLSGRASPAEGVLADAPPVRAGRPQPGDWPTYNGVVAGNRYSALDRINATNVARLQLQWSYTIPHPLLETTPLVSEGVMYVTGPNRVSALDARTGREIWRYTRPRSPAGTIAGDAAQGAQRGAALLGDRVFFITDNAHLLCLHRLTGALMWDVAMPESKGPYGGTSAPLVAGNLVIAGVAGGDMGIRGFLAAYDAATGRQAWRFWTVPKPGEPAAETWHGKAIDVGGGATWVTGSYDPETGILYWPTGNPFPDTDGDDRGGDNLYTNCVLALDARTGKLRWHYQFTPHDLHDWDATEPLLLVDAPWHGRDRKLLLQANRSGFFYVLDRVTGEVLLAEPFVKKLTWASGVGKNGRPVLVKGNDPTPRGVKSCPAVRGATNWYATAFHPAAGLFYVMAVEDCNIYRQAALGGYEPYRDPADPPEKYLRAIDVQTGKIAWEIKQVGAPEANYSGVLATAGGLVFYGETGGGFAAVEAKAGRTLWHFETNEVWKASPMTYMMAGKQYVAIAAGGNILSFALP
jgi:PQQ-dependent dehydrogenase (methanol/ethanol family)